MSCRGWLLLAAAPRFKWGARLIAPEVIPVVLALGYVALVSARLGQAEISAAIPSNGV